MKHIRHTFSLILALTAIALPAAGQGIYDALRFSKVEYEGTARSLAMGNAFTAVGGDLGAVVYNPAATAIYLQSSLTITPSLNISNETSRFLDQTYANNHTRFGLSNLGYVANYETGRNRGLIRLNFGIVSNQVANYNSRTSAYGTNHQSSLLSALAVGSQGYDPSQLGYSETFDPFAQTLIPAPYIQAYNCYLTDPIWEGDQFSGEYIGATEIFDNDGYITLAGPVNQSYDRISSGYNNDIAFSLAGNISNTLFFGVNISIQTLWFRQDEYIHEYAVDPDDFQETGFRNMKYGFSLTSSGIGINARAGVIWLPVQGLRLGASVATPTWMNLQDQWFHSMDSQLDQRYYCDSPSYTYNYNLRTPLRWNLGAAYTFAGRGMISVDYEKVDYSAIQMKDIADPFAFREENELIQQSFLASDVLRAGAELRATEQLSLRAGYNYYGKSNREFDDSRQYVSAGLGYADNGYFIDVAYQQPLNRNSETFTFYPGNFQDSPQIHNQYRTFRILLTLGVRF